MIAKKSLVGQLKEAAQLLDVLGEESFRSRAYANAARQLDAFDGDFERLVDESGLTRIRGIGAGLAAELLVALEGGELPALVELRERVPESVRELFRVSGLGAKKIATLWEGGVDGLEALVLAAEEGRLVALKGFGARSAENALAGARFVLEAKRRLRLDQAERLAAALTAALGERLGGARVAVAGALRRGCETVDEIELVVVDAAPRRLEAALAELLEEVDPNGLVGSVAGRRVRVTPCESAVFGAVFALRTGSDAYLQTLHDAAGRRDLALGEAGLVGEAGRVDTPSERDLFEALALPLVAPELREEAGAEPVEGLLTLGEVRGLVHNHSTWSDAEHSIREMVAAARERDYAYLAMADHSRSSAVANGLSVERLLAQAEEIRAIRAELAAEGSDFELLHGVEVDILPDGSLDYPDEVLAALDYTVVSVHQNFTLSREAQTERIVRAVRHPLASILGHASGRLLLQRPPYDVDLQAVITACAEAGTVIEINASPYRLDLDWRWVRRARDLGCHFSIDPDAHHVAGYDDVRFGVIMARKAGLRASEVVNTATTGRAFLERLKRSKKAR